MEQNLTSGSVLKNVLTYCLPYLLSYFLQTLYGMADLFIIGQFEGVASTTAVSIGSQVMHMLTVMLVGLAMGATVSIAQDVGAGDHKKAVGHIGNTVTLFMLLSLVLTGILLALVGPITRVMSTPAEAVSGTRAYLTICFLGIPFITAYNIISSVFRGMGDSKSPMYFVAVACVANILLDYLFMGPLHLGPAGAALGTTLSQTVSVILSLTVILRRKMGISVKKADFRPQRPLMGQILKIGLPLGAQNIGAGKIDRAVLTLRYATIIATGLGLLVAVVIQFVAQPMVGLFTTDTVVAAAGGAYLRGYIWDSCLGGIQFSFSGYFCACGKSGISFLHNILAIVLVRVPGAYLTSALFPQTLFPMGLATACGSLLSVIICVIAYIWLRRHQVSPGQV